MIRNMRPVLYAQNWVEDVRVNIRAVDMRAVRIMAEGDVWPYRFRFRQLADIMTCHPERHPIRLVR